MEASVKYLPRIDWSDRRVYIEIGLFSALAFSIVVFSWLRDQSVAGLRHRVVAEARLDKASADLAHRIANPLPWKSVVRSPWRLRDLPEVSAVLREFKVAERKSGVLLEDVDGKDVVQSGRERFDLGGTGRVQSLCSFLAELEAQSFLLVPDSLHVLGVVGDDVRFVLTVSSFSKGLGE